jgi:hypothetical protein
LRLKVVLLTFLILVGISLSAVFPAGCLFGDSFVTVSGTVYEWVDATHDARSEIFINEQTEMNGLHEDIPDNRSLEPVPGVHLIFTIMQGDPPCRYELTTDSEGKFDEELHIAPPFFLSCSSSPDVGVSLEVDKAGYYEVKRDFVDSLNPFELNIILVRQLD